MKRIVTAGLAATLAMAMASTAYADILIAFAGPQTGANATFGAQMIAGAEQAVADLNAAGGVLGQQIKLELGDDACDPKQAVAVANQLAGKGVVFVAGHFCSGSSIPASAVYAEEGIVQISPASTNPKFTDERPGPGVFRVCGRDDQQGPTVAEYMLKHFADKNIAILHDKSAYGQGFAEEVQKALNAGGKKEVLFEAITAGEKDYTAIVTKLKDAKIDALFVGGYHTETGLIKRQMVDQGMSTIILGGDALVSEEYWAITGPAGNGTLMSFSPDPRKSDTASAVVKALEAAGKTTEGYAIYSYAAVQAWAQAVTTAGSTDFEPVVKALNEGTFKTALGDVDFNDKGDVTLPGYVMYEWKDGKYDYIDKGAM